MTPDYLLISISFALLVLSAMLIVMFVMVTKALATLAEILRGLQREMSPMINDVRAISLNVAAASESLRGGMQGMGRLSGALGNIGDDLEEGRRAIKGGVEILGVVAGLAAPWLSKLKLFRGK